MTGLAARTRSGWRALIAAHRPLAVLLPASLLISWAVVLVHGDALPPPANTGLLADVLTALAGSPAWQLVWWLWLAGALVIMEPLARRYGVTDLAIVAIGAVLIVSPVSFWAFGWAGTNGPLIFVGALALWLASRYADGRGSGWWLVLCALLAGVLGVMAMLAFLLALLLLIALAVMRREGGLQRVGFAVLAVLASLVLPVLGAVLGLGAIPGTPPVPGGGPLGALRALSRLFDSIIEVGLHAVATSVTGLPNAPAYLYQPLGWVIIAGVVVAFLQARRSRPEGPLAVAVASTVLLAGPLLLLVLRLLYGEWLVIQPAGSAVLLPAFLLVGGTVIRNRASAWIVICWCGFLAVLDVILAAAGTR